MRKRRLGWLQQRRLIEHFVAVTTARTAVSVMDINKSAAAFYFHRLRGAESWNDIAQQGEEMRARFQTFSTLPSGIPSHDTFNLWSGTIYYR